jgi:metallo-beta-lactamase family protein
LARIVLADSAKLQEVDAERANRKGYSRHQPAKPLYTIDDANRAFGLLQPFGYEREMPVAPGIQADFINAGHLLGSAYARVRLADTGQTVLFGGDLGRFGRPVLPDPTLVAEADVLFVESTYGDRVHEPDDDGKRLAGIINDTVSRGGKLIIPAFALGRVEEVLYWVHRLEVNGRIPTLPVYVDSPMSRDVLEEYRKRLNELDPEIERIAKDGVQGRRRQFCAFCTDRLKVVATIEESKAVTESQEPSIVISASGMATGGRVLHHLARALPDGRNTVLLPGFQAEGTRGRALIEGSPMVRIHGVEVPVHARIESLDSMSAHADANEIMKWLGGFTRAPTLTCLVHGEPRPMDALKARIEKELRWTVKTPVQGEKMEIDR